EGLNHRVAQIYIEEVNQNKVRFETSSTIRYNKTTKKVSGEESGRWRIRLCIGFFGRSRFRMLWDRNM
ncbi:hypothetical protein, partial [Listeria seeligeri]|uniref:hypothetical protein n=1 Tax=Listeria seeligeri TaxID=1640 RepID=UPI001C8B0A93